MYGGLAVLLLVIAVYSAKPLILKEVDETSQSKDFDASSLPVQLKPPVRWQDGEPLPILNLPRRMNLSFSPRLDR